MAAGDAIVGHVVTFGRVLREAGLEIGPGRSTDAVRALGAVDLARRDDVYFSLRQTLVSRRDELAVFDRAFDAWFLRAPVQPASREQASEPMLRLVEGAASDGGDGGDEERDDALEVGASGQELLRDKDFAELSDDELLRLRELIERIARTRPLRRSRRTRRDPLGEGLDVRGMIRRSLRTGGDPVDRPLLARKEVPRRLVLLCDVSGSMDSYARALLLFLHAAVGAGRGVEAFAFGTRLSRLTPDLATRDPMAALARCTEEVVDWGSGTRIGASLREFNEVWGRRGLSRGAIVVVVSDGWEREDPGLVGREMARLARAAYAVIWVNPLKGNPDYQPLAGGMRAALPFVDRFLAGHNLRSLEELATVLAGIERRHAA
ncbi:MAG TPA: VWA domain-containing protein [Gaiella sp.]|nr:VWA domain-containing protein [Gaiella sp.]